VSVEEEERKGQQESRGRGLGQLGGPAEGPGGDSGLVPGAEDQSHEAEGQEGDSSNGAKKTDLSTVC